MFNQIIVEGVRRRIHMSFPNLSQSELDEKLSRLFPIVPFYCIESWLFQNTDVAVRISRDKYQGRDIEQFVAWRKDRSALDEVDRPKEAVCLKAKHNLELAQGDYPARDVYDAGRSYTTCVDQLSECGALKALLNATASSEDLTT